MSEYKYICFLFNTFYFFNGFDREKKNNDICYPHAVLEKHLQHYHYAVWTKLTLIYINYNFKYEAVFQALIKFAIHSFCSTI